MFLDSGFLFAFLDQSDHGHKQAVQTFDRLVHGVWGTPFISDHVVDELLTLVRSRTGDARAEDAARRILPLPESSIPGLRLLTLPLGELPNTYEVYARYRNREISFTDASTLVIMALHGITHLATFDKALASLAPATAE